MTSEQKGSSETLNKIHRLISEKLADRLEKGGDELSTADIRAAIEWMAKNNWTGVTSGNTGLNTLNGALAAIDPEKIRMITNGSASR